MFQRLLLEDNAAIFTLVAFLVALSFFVTIAWRALRMPRSQIERFANLPFTTDADASRHDAKK
ncbi:MAG: hypothetical protein ACHQ4G_10395 [Opitutales bacterium]